MKKILKYIAIYIITITILIITQNLILRIPNNLIEKNIKESSTYLEKSGDKQYLINSDNKYLKEAFKLDNFTDSITLNLIWNNTNKTQIQMNYYYDGQSGVKSLEKTLNENKTPNLEYSRYHQGQITYVKLLLLLFNLKEIRIINCIIITILIVYLLFILYKKSKLLSIALALSLFSINIFVVPLTIQFFTTFLIMLVFSIITIKTLDKDDKTFLLLMMLSGLITNYFDFLTTETLTLTVPLLLRIYLKNNNKKINFKQILLFIIKSCIVWGLSYIISFVIKWILSTSIYGLTEITKTWEFAKIRIYDIPTNNLILFIISSILNSLSFLMPFSLLKASPVIIIIFILFILWLFIFELNRKKQKMYLLMIIISLIPIIRFIVLYAHTAVHLYFVYRALIPLMITLIMIIIESTISKIVK